MPSFIYITDVFCPWCFGFAPVMKKLVEEYRFPVRTLCGELVDNPTPTSKMGTPAVPCGSPSSEKRCKLPVLSEINA